MHIIIPLRLTLILLLLSSPVLAVLWGADTTDADARDAVRSVQTFLTTSHRFKPIEDVVDSGYRPTLVFNGEAPRHATSAEVYQALYEKYSCRLSKLRSQTRFENDPVERANFTLLFAKLTAFTGFIPGGADSRVYVTSLMKSLMAISNGKIRCEMKVNRGWAALYAGMIKGNILGQDIMPTVGFEPDYNEAWQCLEEAGKYSRSKLVPLAQSALIVVNIDRWSPGNVLRSREETLETAQKYFDCFSEITTSSRPRTTQTPPSPSALHSFIHPGTKNSIGSERKSLEPWAGLMDTVKQQLIQVSDQSDQADHENTTNNSQSISNDPSAADGGGTDDEMDSVDAANEPQKMAENELGSGEMQIDNHPAINIGLNPSQEVLASTASSSLDNFEEHAGEPAPSKGKKKKQQQKKSRGKNKDPEAYKIVKAAAYAYYDTLEDLPNTSQILDYLDQDYPIYMTRLRQGKEDSSQLIRQGLIVHMFKNGDRTLAGCSNQDVELVVQMKAFSEMGGKSAKDVLLYLKKNHLDLLESSASYKKTLIKYNGIRWVMKVFNRKGFPALRKKTRTTNDKKRQALFNYGVVHVRESSGPVKYENVKNYLQKSHRTLLAQTDLSDQDTSLPNFVRRIIKRGKKKA